MDKGITVRHQAVYLKVLPVETDETGKRKRH